MPVPICQLNRSPACSPMLQKLTCQAARSGKHRRTRRYGLEPREAPTAVEAAGRRAGPVMATVEVVATAEVATRTPVEVPAQTPEEVKAGTEGNTEEAATRPSSKHVPISRR